MLYASTLEPPFCSELEKTCFELKNSEEWLGKSEPAI